MTTHAVCAECKKEFDYVLKSGFPRKYCDECSAKKKAEWEAKKQGTTPEKVAQSPSMGQIAVTEGISEVKHEFQSEYEFGPAGNRHKIKYRTIEELKQRMKELENEGYLEVA